MLNSLLTWIFKTRSFVKPKSSTQGFTLMELMVAASMTLVVVGMAGWALLTIVKSNKIAKATSEMQYDFNRAVEFMVEEIKGGKKIYHGTDLESDLAGISGTFNTYYQSRKSWITPVLAFQPDASVGEYVVYYIVDTDNSGSTGENWAGRYVLYRWGPDYGTDGKYKTGDYDSNSSTPNTIQPPSSWSGSALVDMVLGTWEEDDFDKRRCRRRSDTSEQWKRYPKADASYDNLDDSSDRDIKGFFICVPTAGELKGEQVEIHAYGQIEATGSKNAYTNNSLTYGVVTNAFMRGGETSLINGGKTLLTLFTCAPGSAVCPDYVANEDIKVEETYVHSDPGGSSSDPEKGRLTDSDMGSPLALVSQSYNYSFATILKGTNFVLDCLGGVCSTSPIQSSSSTKYKTATDGDLVSEITGKPETDLDTQNLMSILTAKNFINDGKISLQPNQFLAFFEARPNEIKFDESKNTNFDDLIIKVTVTSTAP